MLVILPFLAKRRSVLLPRLLCQVARPPGDRTGGVWAVALSDRERSPLGGVGYNSLQRSLTAHDNGHVSGGLSPVRPGDC